MVNALTKSPFVNYSKLTVQLWSTSMWEDMKYKLACLAIFVLIVRYPGPAFVEAATSTATVTLHVTIGPSSQLTLNDSTADPSIKFRKGRLISATKFGAGATAGVKTGSTPAILTVAASDDLMTREDNDPTSGVTATVTDTSGNLFLAAPADPNQPANRTAAGQGCSASHSDTFNWYLEKSWNCDSAKHGVTVIYTLTSP
jgi:hypothetical protein